MPTVSNSGAPLVAIAPSAATASRHTTAGDGRFAALLAPLAAEFAKGGSRSPQPETLAVRDRSPESHNPPAEQPKVAIQPADDAEAETPRKVGDGGTAQSTQAVATKPGESGGPVVRDPAAAPESSMPVPTGSAAPSQQIGRSGSSQVGPVTKQAASTAAVASVVDTNREQIEPSPAIRDGSRDAVALSNEVLPQSDGLPVTKADSPSKPDEPNSGIATSATAVGMVAVAEPLCRSPPGTAPAPDAANPSETASSVVSAGSDTPVKVNAGMRASAKLTPDKATQETTRATVAELTSGKHVSLVPQSAAIDTSPAVSAAAAAVGAHVTAKSPSDIANALPMTSVGTVAVVSRGALAVAVPQGDAANLPSMTIGMHTAATLHSDAGDPSTVTSVGTVAPADANTAAMPALDPTSSRPAAAPTLPAGNSVAATATPQTQPHDARSDSTTSPPYIAGVATPNAPSDVSTVPPSGLTAAPSAGTATQQVAVHVAQSMNAGGKTVTIELHPAELGRVEIHFSFHSDGTDVRLTVDRPETYDAFSHDRSGLQQQLAQAGVDLGGGGLDLRLGQQQPDQSGSYSGGRTSRVTMPTPQPDASPTTLWVSNSLLDILA